MKKYLYLILVAVLALAMLTACGGEQTPETSGTTAAPTVPVDPNAIASCVTGDKLVYVQTVEELLAAIDPTGNTVVTLLKDIENKKAIELPYACTVDFAGCTVSTNPQQGLGIQVLAKGSENATTTLKNGKLVTYSDSIRVKEGALVVSGMDIRTAYGHSVVLYDVDGAYKAVNRIENTTIVSDSGAALSFGQQDADYSDTGIVVKNTTMICPKEDGAMIFAKANSEVVTGQIDLQEGVKLYSYNDLACQDGTVFGARVAVKEWNVTATAGEESWENMTCWNTDGDQEKVLNVLMIGNSFCHSFVDELYAMAEVAGVQVNLTNLYYAGCSIKSHWTWLQNPLEAKPSEFFITGSLGRFEHPTITGLGDALQYADWDVITCQQHFDIGRTVDYETALESCTPYAGNMFSYLKENFPNAKLYWQETWSYGVGYVYPTNKDDDPNNDKENADCSSVAIQTHQYEMIRDVSKTLCQESNVLMIPSGDAWQLARGRLGDTLNKADFAHDGDGGGGQYLNAAVWLEVLTGKSVLGNTWRPSSYILMEDRIPALQQSAHEAVAAIYGEDYAK